MKRITFVIATCLLAAMSFNSCVVEESDRKDQSGTEKAYQMFMYWRYGYSNTQMRLANVAFNFNAWLSAPENSRDSVALTNTRRSIRLKLRINCSRNPVLHGR